MKLYNINAPRKKTNNIIYNSPHSGEAFPTDFVEESNVKLDILLKSGDSFVDQLYHDVPKNGSTLFSNNYGRSFIDTNREAYELDPRMFSGNVNEALNTKSRKVKMGYGSIAKYAYNREPIYKNKIPFNIAQTRVNDFYLPIHQKLNHLLTEKFNDYGYSLLIDCHSMPSYGFIGRIDTDNTEFDIIIGTYYGKSCGEQLADYITDYFKSCDLKVARNAPFAGGYNTQHYGNPEKNHHAIQIEINKALYMNEFTRELNENFSALKSILTKFSQDIDRDINQLVTIKK